MPRPAVTREACGRARPPPILGAMRYLVVAAALVILVALVARRPAGKRALLALLAVLALYAVLKMTGVIELITPSRSGVR